MNTNGSYVTRAELSAHLGPIRDDLSEVKGDVKMLLAGQAQQVGESQYGRRVTDRTLAMLAIVVAAAGSLGAILAVVLGTS